MARSSLHDHVERVQPAHVGEQTGALDGIGGRRPDRLGPARGNQCRDAIERLAGEGLIYEGVLEPPKGKVVEDWEPVELTLFRSTQFGDDQDRPLKKSDGSWTYFANDIAYHHDKFRRGFRNLIDVWGADHGGYVKRMQAAVKATTDSSAVEVVSTTGS